MIVRSTGKVPAPGFGVASEPIAIWGESAPKSLLGAALLGVLLPPPYPPPPPQATRPSTEDSIAKITRSLRERSVGIMLLLGKRPECTLTARAPASFRPTPLFHKPSLYTTFLAPV